MYAFLNLAFQDPGSCGLIEAGNFEDLRCVYPTISPAAHNMIVVDIELVHRNLKPVSEKELKVYE